MADAELVERAEQELRHSHLILELTLDYVDSVPDLEFAREDLQDATFDLRQALAGKDDSLVRRYIDEVQSLQREIGRLLNQ
jgi:hypothetical protein